MFFGVFLFAGMALGKLARVVVDEATGSHAGPVDRLCGAVLGAVRVGLIAVTIVVVFDRLVPAFLQPQWLTGSKLRPWLSAAGQRGFNSLPPDLAATIDRLTQRSGRYSRPDTLRHAFDQLAGEPLIRAARRWLQVAASDF